MAGQKQAAKDAKDTNMKRGRYDELKGIRCYVRSERNVCEDVALGHPSRVQETEAEAERINNGFG